MTAQSNTERTITTPEMSDAVTAYAAGLGDGVAELVDVAPAVGAIEDQPFYNVILAGEKPVFGWLVWELTGFWLEAQRHVMVERDGKLVDITPPIDGEAQVLFIRDSDWAFDYLNPKPVRKAQRHLLTDDADVVKWAKLADEFDLFKFRHTSFKGEKSEFVIPEGKDHRRMERMQRDYNAAARICLAK
ncbi:hypothetical protein KUL25_08070 [Rhodobacteraceae bacterium N5(2021)]|uniref:Uncharacterized protein n=1 Tax=Gymnodinialimonas phycosphaerae TaxID=2841589 RepID=A0A975TYD8_9RHOB|nr:hypothetical protein [Gymnodinialimonas phycosphaerae]MBY4892718.1 hypothetical protein [Gymnodinialimonas phycosphaerae]